MALYSNCFSKLVNGGNSMGNNKSNNTNSLPSPAGGFPLRKQNTRMISQLNNLNIATNGSLCMNERKWKTEFEMHFHDVVHDIVKTTLTDCLEYNY